MFCDEFFFSLTDSSSSYYESYYLLMCLTPMFLSLRHSSPNVITPFSFLYLYLFSFFIVCQIVSLTFTSFNYLINLLALLRLFFSSFFLFSLMVISLFLSIFHFIFFIFIFHFLFLCLAHHYFITIHILNNFFFFD